MVIVHLLSLRLTPDWRRHFRTIPLALMLNYSPGGRTSLEEQGAGPWCFCCTRLSFCLWGQLLLFPVISSRSMLHHSQLHARHPHLLSIEGGDKSYSGCASLSFSRWPPPFVLFLPSPSSASAALLSFCRTRSAFALHSTLPGAQGQYTYHAKFAAAWWLKKKKKNAKKRNLLPIIHSLEWQDPTDSTPESSLQQRSSPTPACPGEVWFLLWPSLCRHILLLVSYRDRVLCLPHPPKAETGFKQKEGGVTDKGKKKMKRTGERKKKKSLQCSWLQTGENKGFLSEPTSWAPLSRSKSNVEKVSDFQLKCFPSAAIRSQGYKCRPGV